MEHKEDLHPQYCDRRSKDERASRLLFHSGGRARNGFPESDDVVAGAMLAKTPRKVARTKDITGGLPRVAELFEARRPKDAAEIAKIDGVRLSLPVRRAGKRKLLVRDPVTGEEEEHLIPMGKHVVVFQGDHVEKGQQLDGRSGGAARNFGSLWTARIARVLGERSAGRLPPTGCGN